VVHALVDQYRLRIDYRSVASDSRVHEVEPYTLIAYRGGLYLLGKSNLAKKVIWSRLDGSGP